jgi:NhaA family Na+:H+ antiporter
MNSMKLTKLFREFADSGQASGVVLLMCTIVAIVVTNSSMGEAYLHFWHTPAGFDAWGMMPGYSLEHWVNDGLMAIFFLLIGLEIERELYIGELSDLKSASLPVIAAIGGMVTPALFHFLFNHGSSTQSGFGIPMATDIAFAIGVLMLLGDKVPPALKIFLSALAIVDDLGAIMVITVFYTSDFSWPYLAVALGIFLGLLVLNRLKVQALPVYLLAGVVMWFFMLKSGIHASIAGVLLAFAIPFANACENQPTHDCSPSYRLQHFLHWPVAFLIMPIFALANSGIRLEGNWSDSLVSSNSLGIISGLLLGKPIGIVLCTWLAIRFGISRLPKAVSWRHIIGTGFIGGIGFTMSTFITVLAFTDAELMQSSKLAVLAGSLLSGIAGFIVLNRRLPTGRPHINNQANSTLAR